MAERDTTVGPEEGLHARPAAQFVKAAKQYSSDIVVVKGDREANAKSSLKIMTLGAKKGDQITIRAEGEDAEEAVESLAELISQPAHLSTLPAVACQHARCAGSSAFRPPTRS